jgi:predicted RNA-binding protein (virulence factor B family)
MAKLTEAQKRKNFEATVGSSENDMGPLPELEPRGYSPKDISSKKPEPTFKSDVDNIVSGVKKVDRKINDTLDPVRKVMVKAAGKEEPGILSKYSGLTKFVDKKKGGMIKSSASKRADGIAIRGKTRA